MAAKKRSLAKNNSKRPAENLSTEIRVLIKDAQAALKSGAFSEAIEHSKKVEDALKSAPERAGYYLTSILWQIRAYQALHDAANTEQRIDDYFNESARLNHLQHLVQAHRMRAQQQIDKADFGSAIDTLAHAVDVAIDLNDPRLTFELFMHLSSLEIKLARYPEAKQHLTAAMMCLDKVQISPQELQDIMAIGNRQLCELFIKTGDGEAAEQALHLAISAHTSDQEENWLQTILYSHLEKTTEHFDHAVGMMESVKNDIQNHPKAPNYKTHLDTVHLELAQLYWDSGKYDEARTMLNEIQSESVSLQRAIALTRYQWAVISGKPSDDADLAESNFYRTPVPDEETDRSLQFAADLTKNAHLMMCCRYKEARDALTYLSERAEFLELMPICTKAKQLIAEIDLAQCNYLKSAEDLAEVAEQYLEHRDLVSSKYTMVLTLRAQYLQKRATDNISTLSEEDEDLLNSLIQDCDDYVEQEYIEAFLDLAIQLLFYTYEAGYIEVCKNLSEKISKYLQADKMAYRTMQYYQMKSRIESDESWMLKAREIAKINGYRIK